MNASRGRVVSEAEARRAIAEARAAGRSVVLTNGAFDLLHVGHVRMLREAAALGDVLVVAVNDDASVAAARGSGRPVVAAAERAEVVAAVAGVAHAFVFPDRTMDRLLEGLRPDVHAKGRDYDEATHPEAPTNRRLGIRMAFVGDEKTRSATALAARLAAADAVGDDDRMADVAVPRGRGLVARSASAWLRAAGLLDLDAVLRREDGEERNRHATRVVRRLEIGGRVVFVKAEWAARPRGRLATVGALAELRGHLALRAAGLRAPAPLAALEGRASDGRRAAVLVTERAPGEALDAWLRARLPGASPREAAGFARGLGRALRAFHTARFLHPDLQAWHLHVAGDLAAGSAAVVFLDLARLSRARTRVRPTAAAPGLAALALTLRGVAPRRWRLRVLRAYLGGSLAEARRFARPLEARIARIATRGAFKAYAGLAP